MAAGDYSLEPRVVVLSPGGGSSTTSLLPLGVTIGCGQTIDAHTDFLVDIESLPLCAEGSLTVAGRVLAEQEITSLELSVNGGAPTSLCAPCGVSPVYSADVELVEGANRIVVVAVDAGGRQASAMTTVHAGSEPSALDQRPFSEPLLVSKAPSGLVLTWERHDGVSSHLFRGTLASLHQARGYDHQAIAACGLIDPEWSEPIASEDVYYLAGAPCAATTSSVGRDSAGAERPPARPACP